MLIVNNSEARVHRIGLPLETDKKGQKKTHSAHITLHPGNNLVEEAAWEKVKGLPAIKASLKRRIFRVVEKNTGKDLSGLAVGDAIEVVNDTFDRDLLKKWAASDKRPDVVSAIGEQLDSVDPTKDKRESKKDE